MMDTAAMPAFLMADFLVKVHHAGDCAGVEDADRMGQVYASASPPARTTIVQVLSRMYSAYDKYTNNASGSVCYIAQFYTIILRRLAISASPSSSRRASPPAGDAAPADEHALLENFYSNSLVSMLSLFLSSRPSALTRVSPPAGAGPAFGPRCGQPRARYTGSQLLVCP